MKTYSGELKDGMPVRLQDETYSIYVSGVSPLHWLKELYHDNEWQLYKPQDKKVWGIPKYGEVIYHLIQSNFGVWAVCYCREQSKTPVRSGIYLDKHTAEQHAKALNYINEFRALSDRPVDDVVQWWIDGEGDIMEEYGLSYKMTNGICGYVANSREKAERDLAAYPKIALAHKIDTWAYHGIVEEVL